MTTTESKDGSPKWPYPDVFIEVEGKRYYSRMTAHRNGQWAKKIPGTNRLWYGGTIDDPDAAMQLWRAEWPRLVRGESVIRAPMPSPGAVKLGDLVNLWGEAKTAMCVAGELSPHTLRKYRWLGVKLASSLGKYRAVESLGATDFLKFRKSIEGYAMSSRSDIIANVRGIFRWGADSGLIDRQPVYGPEFRQPTKAMKRKARHETGTRIIPAADIRYMLVNADVHMRAVIYLGINTGMKSLDVATLGSDILDLDRGVVDGLRRKRWTPMYAPLWPETVRAIREASCDSGPVLQWQGRLPWNGRGTDRVGREFKVFRESLGMDDYTHGQLRHTLRTVGGEVDYRGVRRVMGHLSGDVLDETYDHGKLEAATRRVVDTVRWWLFTSE